MFLAKVIGSVVATQKHPKFQGMKLLLVQPLVAKERTPGASRAAPWSRSTAWAPGSVSSCCSRRAARPASRRRPRTPRSTPSSSASSTRVEIGRHEAGEAVMTGPEAGGGRDRRGGRRAAAGAPRRRPAPAPAAPAPAARARRPARPARKRPARTGTASSPTVDEAVAAAAAAQVRVAEMSLEERGRMIARHPAALRRAGRRARPDGAGRDAHRPPRPQDRQAQGDALRARRRGDAQRRAQRPVRPVRHRAGAVGRDRHGPAGHALGADDGEQRHQHPGGRQHRRVQPAPGRRPRGRLRAALFNREIEREIGVAERHHDRRRAEHRVAPSRSSATRTSRCCA